jgi:hypothetical protein
MRKLALIPFLFAAVALAQSVPPQFVGLLSDTTDYTTDSRWTTPTIPSPGACYYDSTWNVNQCRIPSPTDCPVNSVYNPSGLCSITTTKLNVDYAKTVPWSVDDSYYIATELGGWLYVYSRSSGGVYTFVRRLQTGQTSYGSTRDYANGHGLDGDWSNWLWADNASSNPHTIYYTGTSITNSNRFQLKAYNVDTDTITVVHDFTSTINTVNGWGTCSYTANAIDMQREGNQSDDDRYWAFGVTNGSAGGWCAVLVYDKTLDSVIGLQTLGANGMCGVPTCASLHTNGYPNWVGMSPLGDYVVVNWQSQGYDTTWTRGEGTEIYSNTLTYLGVASAADGHGDVGYDANGLEVYVDRSSSVSPYAKNAFGICELSAVNTTPGVGGCRHYLTVPCTWGALTCPVTGGRGNTYFVSMRGTHGAAQGWMALSTQTIAGAGAPNPTGNGGWGALENDAVLINWSAGSTDVTAGVPPAASIVRIGRNHGIYAWDSSGDGDYESQANAAPNRTFTKIAWTSNFDVTPLSTCPGNYVGCNYYNMYTELGGGSTSNAGMSGNVRMSGNAVIR